jgi:Uma2 family endonuclease
MQLMMPEAVLSGAVILSAPCFSNDEMFEEFCAANPDWRLERSAQGEIVLMAPAGGESGYRSGDAFGQLRNWAARDNRGRAFDSNTGFRLANGAVRAPDAGWVLKERLAVLTKQQKRRFLPLCPDFVIEVVSPSDRLKDLQVKMREWIEQGVQCGWLIEPDSQNIEVHVPNSAVEVLKGVERVEGHGVIEGFVLELQDIWAGL